MINYQPKILMAFGETFSDETGEFLGWLIENNYPELAALSSSIRGSKEATAWLMKNKFPRFAALDDAICGSEKAYKWLIENDHNLLTVFVDAINNNMESVKWFKDNDLEIFIHLSRKIRQFRETQSFDYHKLHF